MIESQRLPVGYDWVPFRWAYALHRIQHETDGNRHDDEHQYGSQEHLRDPALRSLVLSINWGAPCVGALVAIWRGARTRALLEAALCLFGGSFGLIKLGSADPAFRLLPRDRIPANLAMRHAPSSLMNGFQRQIGCQGGFITKLIVESQTSRFLSSFLAPRSRPGRASMRSAVPAEGDRYRGLHGGAWPRGRGPAKAEKKEAREFKLLLLSVGETTDLAVRDEELANIGSPGKRPARPRRRSSSGRPRS